MSSLDQPISFLKLFYFLWCFPVSPNKIFSWAFKVHPVHFQLATVFVCLEPPYLTLSLLVIPCVPRPLARLSVCLPNAGHCAQFWGSCQIPALPRSLPWPSAHLSSLRLCFSWVDSLCLGGFTTNCEVWGWTPQWSFYSCLQFQNSTSCIRDTGVCLMNQWLISGSFLRPLRARRRVGAEVHKAQLFCFCWSACSWPWLLVP